MQYIQPVKAITVNFLVWENTTRKKLHPLELTSKVTTEFADIHGTPKLTIKKLRPAGFARHCSVYHNKIVFTHGFIRLTLSTAIRNRKLFPSKQKTGNAGC